MTGRSIVVLGAALLLLATPALTQDHFAASASGLPYGLPQPCAAGGTAPATAIAAAAVVDDAVICFNVAGR